MCCQSGGTSGHRCTTCSAADQEVLSDASSSVQDCSTSRTRRSPGIRAKFDRVWTILPRAMHDVPMALDAFCVPP